MKRFEDLLGLSVQQAVEFLHGGVPDLVEVLPEKGLRQDETVGL